MYLQVQLSFAPTDREAREAALREWGTNVFDSPVLTDLRTPQHFEAAAEFVTEDDVDGPICISSEPGQHAEWLREYLDLGFDHLYLHNVHRDQRAFVEAFGERVLPDLLS